MALLDGTGLDPKRCALSLEAESPVSRCSIQRKLSAIEGKFMDSLSKISVAHLAKDIVVPSG